MLLRLKLFALTLLLSSGCHKPPSPLEGLSEFILESYLLRQGKEAILERQGVEPRELPEDAFDAYPGEILEGDTLEVVGWPLHQKEAAEPTLEGREASKLSITHQESPLQSVLLLGLSRRDSLPIDRKTTLLEILSRAEIPPEADLFSSYLLRGERELPIDLYRLLYLGDLSQNIVMRAGDTIFIAPPGRATLQVLGEVASPQTLPLPYGTLSLREAIGRAGGLLPTADREAIIVTRGGSLHPKSYLLKWEELLLLPNDSLLLMPGDMVYVGERGTARWSRLLGELLPSRRREKS